MTRPTFRARVKHSPARWARAVRVLRRSLLEIEVPVPLFLVRPLLSLVDAAIALWRNLFRLFVAEPVFRARCAIVGRGFRGSHFVHFVSGTGDIVVGSRVHLDGKCDIQFASILLTRPRLVFGDRTYVNHRCSFVVAREIVVGSDVYMAPGVRIMDSPGHPLDPAARLAKRPPTSDEVRPVNVGDNVWIGTESMIMPGVTIGDGAVIAARSVVTRDVPAYSLAAGAPARVVRNLAVPHEVRRDVEGPVCVEDGTRADRAVHTPGCEK